MNNFNIEKQDVISGSSRLVSKSKFFDKTKYTLNNMQFNLSYIEHLKKIQNKDEDQIILDKFKEKFLNYRNSWKDFANNMYSQDIDDFNYLSTSNQRERLFYF